MSDQAHLLKTFHPVSGFNPWAAMWLAPRRTIRSLIKSNPTYWAWPLAVLGGVVQLMQQSMVYTLGEHITMGTLLVLMLLGGGLLGIFILYVFSYLLYWSGLLLKGRGTPKSLRSAVAWANLPMGVELVLVLMLLPLLWEPAFTAAQPQTMGALVSLGLVGLARIFGGLWALILMVLLVAEVQQFSIWKAMGNLFLVMMMYLLLGLVVFPALMALVGLLMAYAAV